MLLKLSLVAASVLLSSLAARRFGHAVAGALAGMPMIAAPIMALLLLEHPASHVRDIALATLACAPAAVLHIVVFARCGTRLPWGACLALSLGAFLSFGFLLAWADLPAWLVCLLAAVAPGLGLAAMPATCRRAEPMSIPPAELAFRVIAALGMATTILVGAGILPAAASGLLLAVPVTGSVLPAFTLPRHGAAATASLLAGFARGLHGFAGFFIALYFALPHMHPAAAFVLALAVALAVALFMYAARLGDTRRQPP